MQTEHLSIQAEPARQPMLRRETKRYDVVVAGAGLAGLGAAVTAARHGAKVALLQDRPVLGGNASKEIRVWPQGASGGQNAVYFRETGLMEELLLENQYRNSEGNPEIWDTVLLDKVLTQPNLDLCLNTSVFEVEKQGESIRSVTALTLHAEVLTTFEADYFIDCTGDGTVGFLAGAPFMRGRESRANFGETMAPPERQSYTLGGTILFYSRDAGRPVEFHAPAFAHKFTAKDFRSGRHPDKEFARYGGLFWWTEWGGTLDTIHDNEAVKYELLKIAYGVFDWLKNAPENREKHKNMVLDWFGSIPGKRESRRFIGDHVLTQQDVVGRPAFHDAVAFGGWNLDDHAPKGFYDDEKPASFHTQIPGLYNIPLRCLCSKQIPNLLFAGRNISASHLAMTSTRVMLTCGQMGEAAGAAAAMCLQKKISPRLLAESDAVRDLQQRLLRDDHYIVGLPSHESADLARRADVQAAASSQESRVFQEDGSSRLALDVDRLIMFPAQPGLLPWAEVLLTARADATLNWQLHRPDGSGLTIPAAVVAAGSVVLKRGEAQWVRIPLNASIESADNHMLELKQNPDIDWHLADCKVLGLKSFSQVAQRHERGVNEHARFSCLRASSWGGKHQCYCLRLPEDARIYAPANVLNGFARPFKGVNAWVSKVTDFAQPEWLELSWKNAVSISEILLRFDSDLDRHVTAMWRKAPHASEPDLIKEYDVDARVNGAWQTAVKITGNHLRHRVHKLERGLNADAVRLVVKSTHGAARAHVYEMRVY
jgi:hypothetical protein